MPRKSTILLFGLLLLIPAVLISGPATERAPLPIPNGPISFEPPGQDPKEPCYWQSYYQNPTVVWPVPHPTTGDRAYAMRFSVAGPETLIAADIYIHNMGDGSFGNDDIYVTVYSDDGTGLPDAPLAEVTLPAGSYLPYPTVTTVDFTPFDLVMTEDFHIAFSCAGEVDYEGIISDNLTSDGRATMLFDDGQWTFLLDFWGVEGNFLIEAYLCEGSPYEHYDTVWVESFFDVYFGPDPPAPQQPPDDILELNGDLILAWGNSYFNPDSNCREIQTQMVEMELTGESPLFGPVIVTLPSDLPPSEGLTRSSYPDSDFPAESFFDVYYEIEFPSVAWTVIPVVETPPCIESETPIESLPPLFVSHADDECTPYVDRADPSVIMGWLKPNITMKRRTHEHIDTTWVESFFDVVYSPDPPLPEQPPDESWVLEGELILGWADSAYNPQSGHDEIETEIIELNLTGVSPLHGPVEVYLPPDLPPSMGLATSTGSGGEFFPAESFFDVYYRVEFPEAPMAIVADGELPPHLEAMTPIDSLPPYFTDHVDYDYAPFSEASSSKAYVAWIRSHLRVLPHPDDTCYADGDVNGDGIALAVQDLVYLVNFVFNEGPPPNPLYRGDLNGDCHVDQLDVEVLYCFQMWGMICFPIYPVPTCCYPDTVRGACCDYQLDSCLVLAPENCDLIGGGYMGDGAACDPDLCQQVCDCVPGNADGIGTYNILDATHIINYLYKEGPAPIPYENCSGDADCNCAVNILDVTYLINYLYKQGPEPCPCETWVSGCGPLQK